MANAIVMPANIVHARALCNVMAAACATDEGGTTIDKCDVQAMAVAICALLDAALEGAAA